MKRSEVLLIALFVAVLVLLTVLFAILAPSAFRLFFSWPDGGVWSNFVASIVLGVPAIYAILRRLARQHREHLALLRQHHEEHLSALARNHAELLHTVMVTK